MRQVSHLPWQHILGRLNVLEKLVETFSSDIIPSSDLESVCTPQPLTAIVKFVLPGYTNNHTKVSKVSKRLFANLCKSIVQMPRVYEETLEIVSHMEPDAARRLERRLHKTMEEFESSATVEGEGDDETSITESEISQVTPPSSPTRTAPLKDKVFRNASRPHIDMSRVSPSKSKSGKKESNISNKQNSELTAKGATNGESSDLSSISPISPRGEPISFKSEVATPNGSPRRGPFKEKSSNVVNCKEQIEMEEAEAIAVAMETSLIQHPLPVVPGLTPQKGTNVIVHVQSEVRFDIQINNF